MCAHAALPLLGEHSIYNALAAVAVGLQYGVPLQAAAESLATLSAGDKRGEILNIGGATIINDCYNSNPKALDNMVRSLAQIPAQRRIVVAGEMLELGPAGEAMHRDCGTTYGAGTESIWCWESAGWRRRWWKLRRERECRRSLWTRRKKRAMAAARGQARRCSAAEGVTRRAAGAALEAVLERSVLVLGMDRAAEADRGPRRSIDVNGTGKNLLYWLLYQKVLSSFISARSESSAILTFRTAFASLTALFIGLIIGPAVVRRLREFQIGQYIREDGPKGPSERKPARPPWAAC